MNFRETAIVSGGLLAQQATVFATGILVARWLGTTGYGTLGTLKSLSGVLLIVTPLGLDLALLKHASFYHDHPAELRTISRALRFLVGGVNVLLLLLVAALLGPALQHVYSDIPDFALLCVVTAAGLVFAADVQIAGALYRVRERVVPFALVANYSQPILRMMLSALVLLAGGGVVAVTVVNAAMFLYAFAAIGFMDRRNRVLPAALPLRQLASKMRQILAESLWMAASLLVYQATRLADVLVLAALTTAGVTGEYVAMSSVAQLIAIYPSAISQTLGPRIAVAYRCGDLPGIIAELRDYLRKAELLGGYLFGGIAVFGTDLDLVFGRAFNFPVLLPVLLASGWYVSAVLAPFGYVLSMTGQHREEVAILASGALLLIMLLLLLIPSLAAVGAALAVAVAFAAVNALRCAYVIRILSFNPLRWADLLPPFCFLAAALACRGVGAAVTGRSLPVLLAECVAYSVTATAAYLGLLASTTERHTLGRMFAEQFRAP